MLGDSLASGFGSGARVQRHSGRCCKAARSGGTEADRTRTAHEAMDGPHTTRPIRRRPRSCPRSKCGWMLGRAGGVAVGRRPASWPDRPRTAHVLIRDRPNGLVKSLALRLAMSRTDAHNPEVELGMGASPLCLAELLRTYLSSLSGRPRVRSPGCAPSRNGRRCSPATPWPPPPVTTRRFSPGTAPLELGTVPSPWIGVLPEVLLEGLLFGSFPETGLSPSPLAMPLV